jgi:hypothetical protein
MVSAASRSAVPAGWGRTVGRTFRIFDLLL